MKISRPRPVIDFLFLVYDVGGMFLNLMMEVFIRIAV